MGHDHHFLSRLERISLPHIERAMALYRDPELLQYIFQQARVPEGAERVAISLLDPERGPFLIVQRNGHFVTCLGEGMSPDDLPLITRARLDAITDKMADLRMRLALAEKLTGGKSEVGKILDRMATAGRELSREEFTAIAAWQSVLHGEFVKVFSEASRALDDTRRDLHLGKRIRQQELPLLRRYWNLYFMLGHLALLIAMGSSDFVDVEQPLMSELIWMLSLGLQQCGTLGASVRAAWVVGKFGRRAVPFLKERYLAAKGRGCLMRACLGLVAVGVRHSVLRGELRKLLAKTPPNLDPAERPHAVAQLEELRTLFEIAVARPEQYDQIWRQTCGPRLVAMGLAARLEQGSPYRFQSADDIPMELCPAIVADSVDSIQESRDTMYLYHISVPSMASLAPEALYFPQALLASLNRRFCYSDATSLIQTHKMFITKTQPLRAIERPGRNEPCPCRSGNKYKRCCGLAAANQPSIGAAL